MAGYPILQTKLYRPGGGGGFGLSGAFTQAPEGGMPGTIFLGSGTGRLLQEQGSGLLAEGIGCKECVKQQPERSRKMVFHFWCVGISIRRSLLEIWGA